ncbi:MFS transporter [Actinoplanes sp. NBC_00393]|uniref:MFS transporter n=1 Tax=Actinoplanes sp. NBC_00393 TaxID=2975953 RepID=UPI002E227746
MNRTQRTALAVLTLPCLLVSMDSHVLNLAVPEITADLHPTGAQLLWIIDGYTFLVAGSLLAMGALGDRIGRRRLLLIGVTLFAAVSVVAAFARTPETLIAARALMGVAGATLMPTTLALIRGLFREPRERTTALAVWTASFSLGGLLAPLVGGLLLAHLWWGAVFLLAVPVAVLVLAAGPALPELRDPDPAGFDVAGAALSLFALLSIVYGIKSGADGHGLTNFAVPVAVGVVLGAVFVRRQHRTPNPLIEPGLFRGPGVAVALVTSVLTFFTHYGIQVAVAQYLQWGIGLAPLQAGLWNMPSVVVYLLATMIAPLAVRHLAPLRVVGAGLLAVAAGAAVLTLVAVGGTAGTPADLALVVAGSSLFSLGLAPVYALTTELIVTGTRPERAATAGAVAETGAEFGGALGMALLGSLGVAVYRHAYPAVGGMAVPEPARPAFETAFASITGVAAVISLGAAVLALLATGRRRGPGEAQDRGHRYAEGHREQARQQ